MTDPKSMRNVVINELNLLTKDYESVVRLLVWSKMGDKIGILCSRRRFILREAI